MYSVFETVCTFDIMPHFQSHQSTTLIKCVFAWPDTFFHLFLACKKRYQHFRFVFEKEILIHILIVLYLGQTCAFIHSKKKYK